MLPAPPLLPIRLFPSTFSCIEILQLPVGSRCFESGSYSVKTAPDLVLRLFYTVPGFIRRKQLRERSVEEIQQSPWALVALHRACFRCFLSPSHINQPLNQLNSYLLVPTVCQALTALSAIGTSDLYFGFCGSFVHIAIILQTSFACTREGFYPTPFSEQRPWCTMKHLRVPTPPYSLLLSAFRNNTGDLF